MGHGIIIDKEKKERDSSPLLRKEMVAILKIRPFFKAVKVETGGYAITWNSEIDISEYELWQNGMPTNA